MWGANNAQGFRNVQFEILNPRHADASAIVFARAHKLILWALNITATRSDATNAGCRVKDDASGIELVWRLV